MESRRKLIALMYSLGYFGISIFTQTTVKWYQYYYAPPEANQAGLKTLVPLGFIGLAMIVARIFDGIADPLVAYFSDKCKSTKGRRIPFILYGSFPLAATFILLWFPPVEGESMLNFVYLTAMLSLFFVFFTIVVAPYLALIGELSKTNQERISLTMMQGITQIIGVMTAEAGSGVIINLTNFRVMGLTLGLVALAAILLTPIFVKEDVTAESIRPSVDLFTSIKMTLTNKDFTYYLASYMSIWFGINALTISMPYICEVLLKTSAESSGFFIAGAFIVALLFSPFLPKLTLVYGKKRLLTVTSMVLAMILMSTGLFGIVFSYLTAAAIVVLSGLPIAVMFIVPNAMIADIAELDGIKHGQRREGMFFGTQGFVIKLVIGFSSFITPLVFKTFGYSVDKPLGLQLIGPVAGLIILFSILFLNKYSLTEDKLQQIKVNVHSGQGL